MKRFSKIVGTGHFVPDRILDNHAIGAMVGSTDEWIFERTGIRSRRFIAPGESNTMLAVEASQLALAAANIEAGDIDAIVFATLSPDLAFPGNGVLLADKLGHNKIPALDVRNQCSGFVYGLSVADAWIRCGNYDTVLVVGSEVHSTGLDLSPNGRDVSILFGDGAGAVVLCGSDEPGILDIQLGADGSHASLLFVETPSAKRFPNIDADAIANGDHFPKLQGRSVFRKAVEILTDAVRETLAKHALDPQTTKFVPHQANQRIVDMIGTKLGVPSEHVVTTIETTANTTAASIPIAIDRGLASGQLKVGDDVILFAFGSGLTWGTVYLRI